MLTIVLLVIALMVVGGTILLIMTKPSLERNWSPDLVVMPTIDFLDDDKVLIKNIRNINYRTTRDYDVAFYDKIIDLNEVDSAWLVISPFGPFGVAHTFVSFGMADGSYFSISIEVRRRKGVKFSAIKAFFRQFEIMYVIADESDVIKVRTNTIGATVRLFPIQTEQSRIRAVLVDMLERADSLGKKPEFYNTIWNNCTTNLITHVRRFSDKAIPFWNLYYLLPDNLDKIAYKLKIIDTDLSYEAARKHFDITEIGQASEEAEDFSRAIRASF